MICSSSAIRSSLATAEVDEAAERRGRRRARRSGRPSPRPSALSSTSQTTQLTAGQRRRGDRDPDRGREQPPQLEAAELAAQDDRLGDDRGASSRSRCRRRSRRSRTACRAASAARAETTRSIIASAGRLPGPLEAEEGPRLQQVEAVGRQREGEPEERRGDERGLGRVEFAALVDEPDHRVREDEDRRRRRHQDEEDLAHPVRHRRPQVVDLPARWRSGPGSGRGRSRSPPRRSPAAAGRGGTLCRSPPALRR